MTLDATLRLLKLYSIPLASLVGMAVVVAAGFSPNEYLVQVAQIPPPHPYPTALVLKIAALLAVQTMVLLLILRPDSYRHSWGRASFAVFACLAFVVLVAPSGMHAPPAHGWYLLWLLGMFAVMLLLLVWSAIGAIRSRAKA